MITLDKVVITLQAVQDILGLNDWKITPHTATDAQLKKLLKGKVENHIEEIFGCVLIHANFRTAEMYIWDNLDTSKHSQGLEHTVFHECLHIVLHPYDELYMFLFEDESLLVRNVLQWGYTNMEERVINQLSDGFINCLNIIQAKNEPKDQFPK